MDWLSLAIQVPLVGVFVWYSLETGKRQAEMQEKYMAALDKREEAFERRNRAVIDAIASLNSAICQQLQAVGARLEDHNDAVGEKFNQAMSELNRNPRAPRAK